MPAELSGTMGAPIPASHKVSSREQTDIWVCVPESADSQTTSCCASNAQSTALGRTTDDMSDSVTSTIAAAQPSLGSWALPSVQLQCPNCRKGPCRISSTAEPACLSCGFTFAETNGVYNALPQSREAEYSQFVHDYELVRCKRRSWIRSLRLLPGASIPGSYRPQCMAVGDSSAYIPLHGAQAIAVD